MRRVLFFTISFVQIVFSQTITPKLLEFNEYIKIVKTQHPVAKQAELTLDQGNATFQKSKGAFDPKFATDLSQKNFQSKEYYNLLNAGLKIPTWFGIELQTNYEQNNGLFLNPENTVPGAGLWTAGLSFSLLRGMMIDERRAEYRKAQIYQRSTFAEKTNLMNQLLFEASKAYWDWFSTYQNLKIFEEAFSIAEQRFNQVKQGAIFGDKPYIDTIEAGIWVQNRKISLIEAKQEFESSSLQLGVYLWQDGFIPLELAVNTFPTTIEKAVLNQINESKFISRNDTFINQHPEIQLYNYKLKQLEFDRRWKAEQLKPTLNLKYNAINEPINGDPFASFSTNNYKLGVEVYMPLFIRKERGDLKLSKLKISNTELELASKKAVLMYKSNSSFLQWNATISQLEVYTQTVKDYKTLLEAEKKMFTGGESSVFMINSREQGYVNAQLKNIELINKSKKYFIQYLFSLGVLESEL